ncbi:histidine phosphatase family protein [Falsochrobactrum shanghaiense]|uniref:Histidine phosphatase family protein n=1 Tax=Falsochrobactrum shanghaiense TaxID=2201899 RepID=A0A316JAY5_9HYPH|nr:histidine phosphatase family protein [Falsochrobactrum shanghaiense]PWL17909.1 histidine phosphatase family protein [Falsochrobactrum shanghaiense]
MSQLLLLRHAKAVKAKPAMSDFERPLANEGLAALDLLAEAMKKSNLFPQRVVLSGSCRTRETAFGLIERLGVEIETIIDDGIYHGGPGDYMKAIMQHGDVERLMLVAHNPTIEELALSLCGHGNTDSIARLISGFPTAALATISFEKPLPEIARKQGFLESFPIPQIIS